MAHDLHIFLKLKIITVKQNGKRKGKFNPVIGTLETSKEYRFRAREIRKTRYLFRRGIVREYMNEKDGWG